MIDVITLIQTALDAALVQESHGQNMVYNQIRYNLAQTEETEKADPLRSYWLLRQDLSSDTNPDEYIVYTVEEHAPDDGADGAELIFESYVTLRYFCRDSWIGDADKFTVIRNRQKQIRKTLLDADFEISSGWKDVGDVDGISFETFVLEAKFTEVDRGDD